MLNTLGKVKYFSTLELALEYWQIETDPATRDKSAFTTHCGLFECHSVFAHLQQVFDRLHKVGLTLKPVKCE